MLYRDDHLLVVDKPAGLLVHPVPGYGGPTLVHGLLHEIGGEGPRPGIVHRLDRDTSGLLVVARDDRTLARLQSLLRRRRIHRSYSALVRGRPASRRGTIEAPIGRDRRDPTRVSLDSDVAKPAVTHFTIAELCQGRTLLDVELETGRTHQIRVHLAAIGCPVVGDRVYGHGPELGLERQFLHAARLRFPHPVERRGGRCGLAAAARPGGCAGAGAGRRGPGGTGFPLESSRVSVRQPSPRRASSRPVVPLRSCEAPVVSAGYIPNNHVQGGDCVPTTAVTMRELLEAGVHFGHQTRRWNPKMRRFIFGERGGIYIIDLQQSIVMLQDAYDYVRNIAERNGTVLFVGTKKQAQDAVEEQARRVGQPYVNHRWLGGLLTNYRTIQDRIAALHELRRQKAEGQLELLPSKERQSTIAELEKLETNLGGLADTRKLPDAVVVIDMKKEALAVREARRLGITVIGLVDTNCDPDDADFIIPGNDDAIRSTGLIVRVLADAVAEGQLKVRAAEMEAEAARRAAEEAAAAGGRGSRGGRR